jgi:hypothetical protein
VELTKQILMQRIVDSRLEIAFHNGVIKCTEALIAHLDKQPEIKPEPIGQAEEKK